MERHNRNKKIVEANAEMFLLFDLRAVCSLQTWNMQVVEYLAEVLTP